MRTFLFSLVTLTVFTLIPNLAFSQKKSPVQVDLGGKHQLRHEFYFSGDERELQLCGLTPGYTYTLWAVQFGCDATLRFKEQTHGSRTFSFVAKTPCVDLVMERGSQGKTCDGKQFYLSIRCDSCKKGDAAQEKLMNMNVADGYSGEDLIKDVFIGGGCFDVTTVTDVGSPTARGTFNGGSSTIQLDQGVILETGSVFNAEGPNDSESAGNGGVGGNSDPDLDLLTGANLFDVVGITFNFTPTIPTLTFQYVFASEEYCEYAPPNSAGFNDVFGFFISGPGISGGYSNGGENIAVINGGTPASINNINPVSNSSYFVANQDGSCGGSVSMFDIQFDGFTVVLTAVANVIPCSTYHIRLMTADAGDGIFDSAVFLGANSFSAGGTSTGEAFSATTQTNLTYEHCNDGQFIFTRAAGDLNLPVVIEYEILPSSTATPGVDYAPLPGIFTIPPGLESFALPVNVFNDGIPEGIETIILSIYNACSCSSFNITLQIADPPDMEVELPDQEVCAFTPITLEPTVEGGIENGTFSYDWSNGMSGSPLQVVPTETTMYTVTVTDQCGATATATNTVLVAELPTAVITGGGYICSNQSGSSVPVSIDFTGTGPWLFTYAIDGILQDPIETGDNPYVITATQPGSYTIFSLQTVIGDCIGNGIGIVQVLPSEMDATAFASPATCASGGGSVTVDVVGGLPSYFYQWSNGAPSQPTIVNLTPGTYEVTVSDQVGCSVIASATVTQAPPLVTGASASGQATCTNPNGGSITVTSSGGTTPYSYSWSQPGVPNIPNPTGLGAGTYQVTVTDDNNCTATATAVILSDMVLPTAVAAANGIINCNQGSSALNGAGSSTGNFSYLWTGPGVASGGTTLNATANQSGVYVLTVTNNANGCTSTASATVNSDLANPTAAATGGELDCSASQIPLSGTGSSTGINFLYNWTGPGIVGGGATLNPTVNENGTYVLTVTNQINGCTATATAQVTSSTLLPPVLIAPPAQLNCNVQSVTVDGTGSASGAGITYQWFTGGSPIAGATNPTLDVSNPGSYQLVVTDNANGCTAAQSAVVQQDIAEPQVGASANGQITCAVSSVGLTGTVNGNASNFTFVWSTPDGIISAGGNTPNPTAGAPGTYILVVSNNQTGCTNEASVTVTQTNDIPIVEIAPNDNLDCVVNNLQLNANASSQGANFNFTWTFTPAPGASGAGFVSGQNSLTPVVNAPGTYTLNILNSNNGCDNSATATVTQDIVQPDLDLPAVPTLDCQTTSISIVGTVSNFLPGDLDFVWTSPDGVVNGNVNQISASVSTPGTYVLTATNPASGCTSSVSVTVDQDIEEPTVQIASPDILTCANNTVSLSGNGSSTGNNFNYSWTTTNGEIVSGENTLTPVVNEPGTYVLVVTNTANHCTETAQVQVTENANTPLAEAGAPATLTCATPQLPLGGSGSTGAEFEYLWTTQNGDILSGATTLTPVIAEPGDYVLLVTNLLNACTETDVVTIGQNLTPPVAEAGTGGELSCTQTSMQLSGAGSTASNASYQWTSPDGNITGGGTTLTPTVNAPGTYFITVTNLANGCTASDQVEILEDDDLPDVEAGTAAPITCLVNQVQLDATGTVTGAIYSYQWSTQTGNIVNGATTLTPTVNEPGIYVLTVTNTATNCSNIGSVTVDEQTTPPAVEAGTTDELTCNIQSLDLDGAGSATGSNFTYLWTTQDGNIQSGATTLTPEISEPGTYQLVVTNVTTGCTAADQVAITQSVDAPNSVIAPPATLTCILEQQTLNGTGSSNGTQFTYAWTTTGGNIVSGQNANSAVVNAPGTYQLLVTNVLNGCTEAEQVQVIENVQAPTAEAGSTDQLNCDVQSLSLDGAGSTASNATYQWTTQNGNIVSGSTSLTPSVDAPGTYVLLVTSNVNGCTASDNVLVTIDENVPSVVILPPAMLTCVTQTTTLVANAPTGSQFEYAWVTNGGVIVSGANTLTPSVSGAGSYVLTVTNLDNGCEKTVATNVTQNVVPPVADAGQPFNMDCFSDVQFLDGGNSDGQGALSFSWTTSGTGILVSGEDTPTPGVSQQGTYVLTITDLANGCTATDDVVVTRDAPNAEPTVTQPLCFGNPGGLVISGIEGGTPPYLFSIDGGDTFSPQNLWAGLEPGDYSLVIQDAKGCETAMQASITAAEFFAVEVEPQVELKLGDTYQVTAQVNLPMSEIQSVQWFPSTGVECDTCLSTLITPTTSSLYRITVVTENGCRDEAPFFILLDKSGGVYVPNAFTPNGDNINDKFMVYADGKTVAQVKQFLVFSRWGEAVHQFYNFQPNDPDTAWDGKHRGQTLNPAVFAWMAEVEYVDGRTEVFEGDVTLMR